MNSRELLDSDHPGTQSGPVLFGDGFSTPAVLWISIAATAVLAVLGITASTAVAADVCPNAKYRTGASLNLPDCRAYELVTPRLKANEVTTATGGMNAARVTDNGSTILYMTATGPTAQSASIGIPTWERATRSDAWNVERAIAPPLGPFVDTVTGTPRWSVASPDLQRTFSHASAVFDPAQTFDPGGNSQSNGGVFLATATAPSG